MSTVRSERVGDGVVVVLTLDRPDQLNAMNASLIEDLHDALDAVRADASCRVVVLTGAGRVQVGMRVQRHIASLVPKLRSLRQPVIAAVNGAASGGGLALALASDVRVAAESARFNVAFELLLTGRLIDAAEADRIGLGRGSCRTGRCSTRRCRSRRRSRPTRRSASG